MPRMPTEQQRTIVLGRTGTGKSQFAIALLATREWDKRPWVIIDYKGEDLIADIRKQNPGKVKQIYPKDAPPKKPGLYWMQPSPHDDELVEAWLMKAWAQGNIGLFIDEGYALPDKNRAFTAILTQGRTLNIPVIALYQRPVWMNKFTVAQADFFAVFEQNIIGDKKTTAEYVEPAYLSGGRKITVFDRLPPYHCLWYDVSRGKSEVLRPAPDRDTILATFKRRLSRQSNKARTLV